MLKKILPVLMVAAFVLAACQPGAAGTAPQKTSEPMQGCKVVNSMPTPDPTLAKAIPAVGADDHVRGNKDAKVTLIEYSDFECPYCAQASPVFKQLVEKYPQEVRVVYRHFPLPQHKNSLVMAYAAEAAALQGKFLEMDDAIYAGQAEWAALEGASATEWVTAKAKSLGLDVEKLKTDMTTDAVKARVEKNNQEATAANLPGTPFLFINGIPYNSQMDIATLSSLVEFFKLGDRAYKTCPGMVIDVKKSYTATLKTDKGDIEIKLYADKAPLAVNNFVFLARDGWFNNAPFHRVLPGFVAQSGDPSGSGFGSPGYQFVNENLTAKFDKEGLLGMANSGPDTNGSQFFITLAATSNLDGKYTIFGEVSKGMDVVNKLTPRDPSQGGELPTPDNILSVTINEK